MSTEVVPKKRQVLSEDGQLPVAGTWTGDSMASTEPRWRR
jgi:hypothetical protein